MVVEAKAVLVAKITSLADAQDYGLEKSIESSEHLLRRDLGKIPGVDCHLHWFEQGILADTLAATEHERMIDLLLETLNAVSKPLDDMLGVLRVHLIEMI